MTSSPAAVVQAWADKISGDDDQWIKGITPKLSNMYMKSTVKPAKPARELESIHAKSDAVIFHETKRYRGTSEAINVTSLTASSIQAAAMSGFFLRFDDLYFQKKFARWGGHTVYCFVLRHAFERMVERAGATEEDFRAAMLKLAMVSQAFNSSHCIGHDPKMPLLLPFKDGLFLGQSDLLDGIPPGHLFTFDKNGMKPGELAQPKIAVLLGNPPRAMLIRTFIGGDDGLTKAKTRTHALLSDFFSKHDELLQRFSRRALFEFETKDLAHAMAIQFQSYGRELMAEIDKVQGKDAVAVEPLDPLEVAFRDAGDRAAFRAMLAEYQGLLEDDAVKSVLASSAKHVR